MGLIAGPAGPLLGGVKGLFSPPPGLSNIQGLIHGFLNGSPLYRLINSGVHAATGTLNQWGNPADNPFTRAASGMPSGGIPPLLDQLGLPTNAETNNPPMYMSGVGPVPVDALPVNAETNNPPMYAGGGGGGGGGGGAGGFGGYSGYPGGMASYAQGTYGGGGGGSFLQWLQAQRQH